jgi:hypothetical protein
LKFFSICLTWIFVAKKMKNIRNIHDMINVKSSRTNSFFYKRSIVRGRSSNGRALDSKSNGCGFKSRRPHFFTKFAYQYYSLFNFHIKKIIWICHKNKMKSLDKFNLIIKGISLTKSWIKFFLIKPKRTIYQDSVIKSIEGMR